MTTNDLSTARWRKSGQSIAEGSCVELATDGRTWVAVRDSKQPSGPALVLGVGALVSLVRTCDAMR